MARRKAPDVRHDADRSNRIVTVDERLIEYRASAVGGCSRALVCAGLGYEGHQPPDWMQEKFDEGHTLEPVVVGWLKEGRAFNTRGGGTESFHDVGREQEPHDLQVGVVEQDGVDYTVVVRAHSDAMGKIGGFEVDIEIKCVGDDLWGDFRSKGLAGLHHYAWQVSARMHAHGLPVAFVVARKKGSLSKGDLEIVDVLVEIVTEPPIPMRDFKRRLLKVENAIGDAEADAELPPCDIRQYPCLYWYLHDDTENETRTRVDDALLAGQVAAYKAAAAEEADAKKRKDLFMAGIKAWMDANGMGVDGARYEVGDFKVTYVASFVPSRVTEERTDRYVRVTAKRKGGRPAKKGDTQ